MHIFWKYITDSSLKMSCVGIFVKHTLCFLYWNQKKFCKLEQSEDNSYNLPWVRVSLAMSWRSGSFQLKSVQTKKVKIPWEKKSINCVMVNAIPWEVLMPSTKCEGLSYPAHFLKSRGSVIMNNFHEYRTKQITLFCATKRFLCLVRFK